MPPLTPDTKKYKAIGLLKQSQLKSVSLVEEIGSGKRYVAHQLKTPSTLTKEAAADRLEQEATALSGVSHPNLPHFEGYQTTATGNWFLFEYLDGYPLSQHKGDTDKVPDKWVLWWFNQILATVNQLHQNKVVIGGFEPKHFLVHGDKLYLVHVGILENLFPETLALLRSPERLTFTSPEHRHSIQTNVSGDLYSAGAIAYWLCAGKAPAFGVKVDEEQVRTSIQEVRKEFPSGVCAIIARLLQFQAQQRYATMAEALALLQPFVPELAGAEPPPPVRPYKVRFFGRETSMRLNTEAVEIEKKAVTPRPPMMPAAAASAPTPMAVDTVKAAREASTPPKPASDTTPVKSPLDVDTMRRVDVVKNNPLDVATSRTERPGAAFVDAARERTPSAGANVARGRVASQGVDLGRPDRVSSQGVEAGRSTRVASQGVDTKVEEPPPPRTAFQEFAEDFVWNVFRKNPLVGFGLCLGALIVVFLVIWALRSNGSTVPAAEGLTLVAGHIDIKAGAQAADWSAASAVTTPQSLVIATQNNGPTVLRFGHNSLLRLESRTTFVFQDWSNKLLKIKVLNGHAWVEPTDTDTAEVTVATGVVEVPAESAAEITIGETANGDTHEPQVKASKGTLEVKTSAGISALTVGNTANFPDSSTASPHPSPH